MESKKYWLKFRDGTIQVSHGKITKDILERGEYGNGVTHFQEYFDMTPYYVHSKWEPTEITIIEEELKREVEREASKVSIENLTKTLNTLSGSMEILKKELQEIKADSITSESFVSIHFPLQDSDRELERTLKATDLALALWDLSQIYRNNRKYKDQEPAIVSEEEFLEVLEKYGINLDRLVV